MSRLVSIASALCLSTGRRALPVDYLDHYPAVLRHGAPIVDGWWRRRGHDVHLARMPARDAPVVAVLLHGAGGHAGMLAPYGRLVAGRAEVVVPDLPGYGLTRVRGPVDYAGWIACVADLVRAQDRPVALLGASMGGLLADDAAAALSTGPGPAVRAVVATCLADPGDREVRRAVTPWPVLGEHAPAVLLHPAADTWTPAGAPRTCAENVAITTNSAHVREALMGEVPGPGEVHRDARLLGRVDRQLVAH